MTSHRPLAAVVAVVVSALLLSACASPDAAPVEPAGALSTSTPEATSSAPSPTGTATPEEAGSDADEIVWSNPNVPAAPQPRVNVPCAEIATSSLRERALGVADVQSMDYEPGNGLTATSQAGLLQCWWADSSSEDVFSELTISVLPDAFNEFDYESAHNESPGTYKEVLGVDSDIDCSVYQKTQSCTMKFIIDDYWVEVTFNGATATVAKKSKAIDVALDLGRHIQSRLQAAGAPAAAFVVPASAQKIWKSCKFVDKSKKLRLAVSSPSLVSPEIDERAMSQRDFAHKRGGLTSCYWHQKSEIPDGEVGEIELEMIPGGGWAYLDLRSRDIDFASEVPSYSVEPATVNGAEDAYLSCNETSYCALTALVGGSYLKVTAVTKDGDDVSAGVQAVKAMEYVITRLP